MVLDINQNTGPSDPNRFTEVNGITFFVASDPSNGAELWKSDGSAAGTTLVKDIQPGVNGSNPQSLTNVNGTLYFRANDGTNGYELWKSDGTAAGTSLVKDIRAGASGSNPQSLTNINGTLCFSANNGTNGYELWKSDGTAAGTSLVKDIQSGKYSSNPRYLTNVNGTFYFRANDGAAHGYELWKTDGTAAGTTLVKDIRSGSLGSGPQDLTNVNGTLYFAANGGTDGKELWKSDGTAAGTTLVKNIQSGGGTSNPHNLTNVNGTLYFNADDGTAGYELWKSDGTAAGTTLVKDIRSGTNSSNPGNLTDVNGTLYFSANDGTNGFELWKSDGTAAGTTLVKDVTSNSFSSNPRYLTNIDGTLYFTADNGTNGYELWKSDGTVAGTILIKDIQPGGGDGKPWYLKNINGTLFFRADDGTNGNELWKSDGTAAGTGLVRDINQVTFSSIPDEVVYANGTAYFKANDGTNGYELWKSDGSAAGTTLVKDIQSGANSSNPGNLTNINGTLYFTANNGTNGIELWKTNGTAAGTTRVKDIQSGSGSSNPGNLTNINGTLYFTANDGTNGNELWKTDGTAAGTTLVKDIQSGSGSSNPGNLTNINGTLYFTANDGTNGNELWKTDGTAAGTTLVKDVQSGSGSSNPGNLTNINGTLYFGASDATNGYELWKTDGTAAGTTLVKDIKPGSGGSTPGYLTNINGTLYFTANDGTNGNELWKTDGTAAGTTLVKDLKLGANSSNPENLTAINGTLYFTANDGSNGDELWKTDGTAAGTTLVKDIQLGANSSNPGNLTNINGTLYFIADDGATGYELWKSDGTAAGTVLDQDISDGKLSSFPAQLINGNGTLFFTADDGLHGRELWFSPLESGTNSAVLSSGNLTISDIDSVGVNNAYNVSVFGTDLIITDSNGTFSSAPLGGTLSNSNKTLTIPLSLISGTITINGRAGNDTLTLDYASNLKLGKSLVFNGGVPNTAPGDKLVILGGNQGNVTYTYTNANDGTIAMSNLDTITYTGLEPITNTGTASNIIFQLPGGPNAVTLGDDGTTGNGLSRLSGATLELTDFANPTGSITIKRGHAADSITVTGIPDLNASLNLGTAVNPLSSISFAGAVALGTNQSLNAYASGTISLPGATSDLTTSGTGSINLTTSKNISMGSGSSITTVDGNLNLSANQQASPTSGNFVGIDLNQATIQVTGTGLLNVLGKGGDDSISGYQIGVQLFNSSFIQGGSSGLATISGTGGASTSQGNFGLYFNHSSLTSLGGNIGVSGYAGGIGTSLGNYGVILAVGSQIEAGGLGTVSVYGHAGGSSGSDHRGVYLGNPGTSISSSGGDVSVTGDGGGSGAATRNVGVEIQAGAQVSAGGTGSVTLLGTGGNGDSDNYGLMLYGSNSQVTSSGGNVSVTGVGGTGSVGRNYGLYLGTAGKLNAGGTGTVTVDGEGGAGASGDWGIYLNEFEVNSSGGAVSVLAKSGENFTPAILIDTGTSILSGGTAPLTITTDSMSTNGTVTATIKAGSSGTGILAIKPMTSGAAIDLGGTFNSSPLTLGLSSGLLSQITAGSLLLGDNQTGNIKASTDLPLPANTTLTTNSGGINLQGKVDGAYNLTINNGGTTTFFGNVGSTTPLTKMTFAGGGNVAVASNGLTIHVPSGSTLVNYILNSGLSSFTLAGPADANATGNTSANNLTGNSGANSLTGGAGNDTLDGGSGTDTAVYTGTYSQYGFSLSSGNLVITDNRGGSPNGSDTLLGIEKLQFSDQTVTLAAPSITSGASASVDYGSSFSWNVISTGTPLPMMYSISSGSLPAGLSINPTTGVISGTSTANAATYHFTINASNGVAPSADQPFTLTIVPRAITVTASSLSGVYGTLAPSSLNGTTGFSVSGMAFSETIGSVTLVTNASLSASGKYEYNPLNWTITPSAATGGTFNAANYAITYNDGILSVTKKGLTITANDVSGVYGSIAFNGSSGFSSSGLVGLETIGGVTLTTNATLSTTGNYTYSPTPWAITPSAATPGTFNPANYSITYQTGSLTVSKRNLTVSATGIDKIYDGTTNATVTLSDNRVTAGLLSDLFTDSYGSAVYTTDKHVGTNKPISVGGISISGPDAGNYTCNTTAATTASIIKKDITVTVPNATHTYGTPVDLNPVVTPGVYNQQGSAFYSTPVNITNFSTRFSFQTTAYTSTPADGITFVIQNAGLSALGANGEGLGYQGIGNSVAVKIDLINNYGEGTNSTGLYTNGVNPSNPSYPSQSLTPKGLDFQSNHVFTVDMTYNGTTLLVQITDTQSRISSFQSYTVNIAGVVGANTALVGFTGGTGVLASKQNILDWNYKNGMTTVIDYSNGFVSTDSATLALNGNAVLRGGLVLTGSNQASQPTTGIFSEDLILLYSSLGNTATSNVGSYLIGATLWDGAGWVSDYYVTIVPGTMTVTPKAITYTIPNQTQTYGSPANLNPTVTPSPFNQAGSVFTMMPVNFSSGFQTNFTFQTSPNTGTVADGLTFTIQRKGAGALGSSGEGLGYQGITKSVAIKFDSFNNRGEGSSSTGIFTGGANPSTLASSINLLAFGIDLSRSDLVSVAINYSATTNDLQLQISQPETTSNGVVIHTFDQTFNIDIADKVLGTSAYFGFTAGTGALISQQAIKTWTLGAGSTFLNYGSGFAGAAGTLMLKGSTEISGTSLVLTGATKPVPAPTGVNDENLAVVLASGGNGVNSAVGSYPITGTVVNGTGNDAALSGNYTVVVIPGTLTVTKANLVITATNMTKVYGSTVALAGTEFTATGLAGTDAISAITLTTSGGLATTGVGNHSITAAGATGTGLSNYNISYQGGTFTVTKKTLTVTPSNRSKTYGDNLSFDGTEFTSIGLVNGNTLTGVNLSSSGTRFDTDVGSYAITATGGSGSGLDNYDLVYLPGALTITPRAINYTVADRTKTQGTLSNLNDKSPNPYNQAGSVFSSSKVSVAAFTSTFTFQTSVVDKTIADGFTFTIQNSSPTALGLRGGGLGYQGINGSVAIKFDMFNNNGEGNNSTGLYINGADPSGTGSSVNLTGGNVDFQTLHPFQVHLNYNGTVLVVTIKDLVTNLSAVQNYAVDIPAIVGGTDAYVGFTGGTGGLVARQEINSWIYNVASAPVIDESNGFLNTAILSFNGSTTVTGQTLAITCAAYGEIINTEVNNETLYVYLTSNGTPVNVASGIYSIFTALVNGSGKASNYIVNFTNGTLTVT